jgi:hypothetical protein
MAYAPLVENFVAVCVQALPVSILLSPRSRAWGTWRFRLGLAFLYLALPNTHEMFGTISEGQWFIALSAFLLIVAAPARSPAAHTCDTILMILCALTGPFAILLFPIAAFFWMQRRDHSTSTVAIIFSFGFLAQSLMLLTHAAGRHHPFIGISAISFLRIIAGQIYLGTLLGSNWLAPSLSLMAAGCIVAAGTAILILCARASTIEMRTLLVLSVVLLGASLASPTAFPYPPMSAWELLALHPGIRYWFFPCLSFAWLLAYGIRSSSQLLQITCGALFILMVAGLLRDYRYPAFPDMKYETYARRAESSSTGTTINIQSIPGDWHIVLIKH